MSIITIYGKEEEEVLSTKLVDLLTCFSNSNRLGYLLVHIEGMSSDSTFNQLEFEATVKNAPNGIYFTYDKLIELEKMSHQLIELELLVLETDEKILTCTNLIAKINLVDGSYWEVETSNDLIMKNILKLEGAEITPQCT